MSKEAKTFGLGMRRDRDALGMTQSDIASRVGLSRQTVVSIEKGRTEVTLTNAVAISRVLNSDLYALMAPPKTLPEPSSDWGY